mmetsp:Transcript_54740/g.65848  ORF Transcript_54740/g.65848 Transcript_54740/m.65848 type:complete len:105 (-) Transcript_54740:671-985(-)
MTISRTPFAVDDMFCPASKGRSLHDESKNFYGEIFKCPTVTEYVLTVDEIYCITKVIDKAGVLLYENHLGWSQHKGSYWIYTNTKSTHQHFSSKCYDDKCTSTK